VNLLIVAAVLLELAVLFAAQLERAAAAPGFVQRVGEVAQEAVPRADTRLGGNPLAGIGLIFQSRYLGGIATWVFLLSLAFTFLYLTQAQVVAGISDNSADRTRIFATIDFVAGLMTVVVQLFATGRVITRFGAGVAAAFLAVVFFVGYGLLSLGPTLLLVLAFQTVQRSATYAIANPARETFFTVVSREEKYKGKSVIDGAVFRGADMVNAWLFAALQTGLGLTVAGVAMVALPIMAAWGALALWLGREQERRAGREEQFPALQREGA
jgi:AAA family ATP:ADP antiporter